MTPLFLIRGMDWTERSAGINMLHKLAEVLTEKGEEVYLGPCRLRKGSTAPLFDGKKVALAVEEKRPIICIEPEIVGGSNSWANLTVRWLLNLPGKANKDVSGTWSKDDLYCHFYDNYKYRDSIPLSLPHIDRTLFHNEDNEFDKWRDVDCFYARKALFSGEKNLCPKGALDLSDAEMSLESLAKLFRHTRKLYVMEFTACSIEAVLCGADHEFIPNAYQPEYPSNRDWGTWYTDFERSSDATVEDFLDECYWRVKLPRKVWVRA
jgi:hypothetical protein